MVPWSGAVPSRSWPPVQLSPSGIDAALLVLARHPRHHPAVLARQARHLLAVLTRQARHHPAVLTLAALPVTALALLAAQRSAGVRAVLKVAAAAGHLPAVVAVRPGRVPHEEPEDPRHQDQAHRDRATDHLEDGAGVVRRGRCGRRCGRRRRGLGADRLLVRQLQRLGRRRVGRRARLVGVAHVRLPSHAASRRAPRCPTKVRPWSGTCSKKVRNAGRRPTGRLRPAGPRAGLRGTPTSTRTAWGRTAARRRTRPRPRAG